ncbi:MAG TPA: amino acid adenylation domain-containing protein [Pseudonocardiaceae bacterium]|nr:amino acid adenylation domain-containing protein [Pseudonocardiaceae bacterium]
MTGDHIGRRQTVGQQQILLAQHIAPESTWHNVPLFVTVTGPVDLPSLRRAVALVARRHVALRSFFHADGGTTVTDRELTPTERDITALPATERTAALAQIRATEERTPFTLDTEPPIRATLVRVDDQTAHLVLVIHHIAVDGHSLTVFQRDLVSAYRTGTLAAPPVLADDVEVPAEQLEYWREQLANPPAPVRLPFAAPANRNRTTAHVDFALPDELAAGIRALAVRQRMTPFMVLLTAFAELLRRYAGAADLIVGTPIAGRDRPETHDIIGYLANTVPLRLRPAEGGSWLDALRMVRDTTLDAYDNADLPFGVLIEELGVTRSPSSHPLFQIVFAAPPVLAPPVAVDDVTFAFGSGPGTESLLDVEIQVFDDGNSMAGYLKYRAESFADTDMSRLLDHYVVLAEHLVAAPAASPADIAVLRPDELRRVVVEWNDTATDYPRDASLVELVTRWARTTPDAVAVRFAGGDLSYGDLDARADRLANVLLHNGVTAGDAVAVAHEFAHEWVIGALAVLKVGAAYVPLDPNYPAARLTMMCADAGVRVALTRRGLADRLAVPVVVLLEEPPGDPTTEAVATPSATDVAYVMYTSGSTGRPKGVAVTHRNIVRLVCDTNYVTFRPGDVVAQAASLSFDAATFEIWGALCNGATLVGIRRDDLLSAAELGAQLRANAVDIMFLTTSLAKQLAAQAPHELSSLRCLVFGGEQPDPRTVAALLAAGGPELVNGYGPTETTTFAATYSWRPGSTPPPVDELIPIGRPISNTTVYVLDADRQPIGVGRVGEIYIGGDGVGVGYVGQPKLTEDRFVPDPFSDGRLYRTGDLGRYREDGAIVCLGRIDRQVKIRGFRIEPGEIENCLHETGLVRAATVQVRQTSSAEPMLVGYVVPQGTASTDEITDRLRGLLPAHLVPSALIALDALPVTANGKLDIDALPDPVVASAAPAEAATPTEAVVLEVWRDVLAMPRLGVHDDFFAIGGHSINAGQVMARLRTTLRITAPLRLIFDNPTVATLAKVLEQRLPKS